VKPEKFKSPKKPKKKRLKVATKTVDAFPSCGTNPKKNNRGRKRSLPWATVTGRASNYEFQLNQVWHRLATPLLAARTKDEVTNAFNQFAQPYSREFVPGLSSDILLLLNDPDFPQRPIPRIKFLARSLAGGSTLSFRSSRDICEKVAAQEMRKSPHRILRREFYIECSCGYKGPALDNDCPHCGAQPQLSLEDWTGKAPGILESKIKRKIVKKAQPELPHQEVAAAANPNSVRCHCGATIEASSRDAALEGLAKHEREEHGNVLNQPSEKSPE
jgi:hypothetical protein